MMSFSVHSILSFLPLFLSLISNSQSIAVKLCKKAHATTCDVEIPRPTLQFLEEASETNDVLGGVVTAAKVSGSKRARSSSMSSGSNSAASSPDIVLASPYKRLRAVSVDLTHEVFADFNEADRIAFTSIKRVLQESLSHLASPRTTSPRGIRMRASKPPRGCLIRTEARKKIAAHEAGDILLSHFDRKVKELAYNSDDIEDVDADFSHYIFSQSYGSNVTRWVRLKWINDRFVKEWNKTKRQVPKVLDSFMRKFGLTEQEVFSGRTPHHEMHISKKIKQEYYRRRISTEIKLIRAMLDEE